MFLHLHIKKDIGISRMVTYIAFTQVDGKTMGIL